MAARHIEFVNDIYDAALDPNGLGALADLTAETLEASSAVLHEIEDGQAAATVSCGIPDRVLDDYNSYYSTVNPLLPAALERIPVGRTAVLSDLMPPRTYFETEFFCDFARRADTAWVLGGLVPVTPSLLVSVNVHRPLAAGDFSPLDRARLQSFLGPAQAALRLRSRLGERREAGFGALDALAFGAVVCHGDGRLVFANAAAEELAQAGCGLSLGWRHGGLSAALPGEASRLAALIGEAAEAARAGAMALTGEEGRRAAILVTPLPRRYGGASQLVLVTLRAAEAAPLADPATLVAAFGLTPAEAAIASTLSTGAGAAEIAAALGISEATVRTHIKRCLAKMGAANQRDLVATLGRLPPMRRHSET